MSDEEEEDSNEDSDESGEENLGSLTDFLLEFYRDMTPQIFD